jgi:rod shape-determining protein MreC
MGRLKLPYLPTSADVVAGDLLVTSGLGGGFPAGYPVGTVAEVKRDPAQSLAEVDVKPAAALDRSRELMFVWMKPQPAATASSTTPTPTPTATPPAPAAAAAAAHTEHTASTAAPTAASAKAPARPPGTAPNPKKTPTAPAARANAQ